MIPIASGESVPVYNCHVLLRRPIAAGERFIARCAAAPSVTAEAATEREVLQALVIRFKYFLQEHRTEQREIPWQTPELSPEPGEVERWVSVHL